jgi:hypothetical protein
MGTPLSPPTRLTVVPDKWVQPTRRPADLTVGPTDLVGGPHDLLKTFQKILDVLIQNNFKTWCVRQDIGGFPTKRINEYGKCCNQLDLGLLVVINQEYRNRPCLLDNIRRAG